MACLITESNCCLNQASKLRTLCNICINDTYAKIILTAIEALAVIGFYDKLSLVSIERTLKQFTES